MSEPQLLFPLLDTVMQIIAVLSLSAAAVLTLPSPLPVLRQLQRRLHRQPRA